LVESRLPEMEPGRPPRLSEERFLAALPEIERVIRFVGRRQRLSKTEEDDFAGEVRLAMVEDDYRIVRSFKGPGLLRTYLVTVVHRLYLDFRRKSWGKWRPSASALRLGPTAVRLEALVHRDGLTVSEAIETVRVNFDATETVEELRAVAQALPPRVSRRPVGEEALADAAQNAGSGADGALEDAITTQRVQLLIDELFALLPAQDRILLRLRFEDDMGVATIARMTGQDQARLYRRFEALLASFRKSFETRGLAWPEVQRMIERGRCHLTLPPKVEHTRTSVQETAP
jgi:RNA polymerase sigma factor (sigma-70 family)